MDLHILCILFIEKRWDRLYRYRVCNNSKDKWVRYWMVPWGCKLRWIIDNKEEYVRNIEFDSGYKERKWKR